VNASSNTLKIITQKLQNTMTKVTRLKAVTCTDSDLKELNDAIDYLFTHGFIEEMTSDKRYYVTKLLEHTAKTMNIELIWKND